MAEHTYALERAKAEVPVSFQKAEIKFWTPDPITDPQDWDGVARMLRETCDDAITAAAHVVGSYNLDRQKAIKDATNAEGATVESVQELALAPEFRLTHKRLKGQGGGRRSGAARVTEKTRATIVEQEYTDLLNDPNMPEAAKQAIRARLEKLASLGVATPEPAAPKSAGNKNKK